MIEQKKIKDLEYTRQHTLTDQDLRKLIRDKLERAERMRLIEPIQERKQIYT